MIPHVITSWDDGHKLDLKIAELLFKYNIKGIFYWPSHFQQNEMEWRKDIAEFFEIGAHTVNHRPLTKISLADAEAEIVDGKDILEQQFGKPVTTFCYPKGYYNDAIVDLVKNAGFFWARTVKVGQIYKYPEQSNINPFETPTAAHVCTSNPAYKDVSWLDCAKELYDQACGDEHNVFHLWGHSWEVEKQKQWAELEEFFKYITS